MRLRVASSLASINSGPPCAGSFRLDLRVAGYRPRWLHARVRCSSPSIATAQTIASTRTASAAHSMVSRQVHRPVLPGTTRSARPPVTTIGWTNVSWKRQRCRESPRGKRHLSHCSGIEAKYQAIRLQWTSRPGPVWRHLGESGIPRSYRFLRPPTGSVRAIFGDAHARWTR